MLLNFAALPFLEVDFQYPAYDYGHSPEPRQEAHPRGRNRKAAPKIFINKKAVFKGRRREIDGEHRKYWTGHCYDVSCREKDMVVDQCRTIRDMIARMIVDEVTGRLVPINASNPTPRLDVEIERDNTGS